MWDVACGITAMHTAYAAHTGCLPRTRLCQANSDQWHKWYMLNVNRESWFARQPGLAVDHLRWASGPQVGADPSTSHKHLVCEDWHLFGSLPG